MDNIEVFQLEPDQVFPGSVFACGECDSAGKDADGDPCWDCDGSGCSFGRGAVGRWFYWTCSPGCLPDSGPFGPYHSEIEAEGAARDEADEPIRIEVSGESIDLTIATEEDGGPGWFASVVVYCDRVDARRDQSIDGSSWEVADGAQGYTILSIGGPEITASDGSPLTTCDPPVVAAFDALIERLKAAGYDVTVLP